MENHYNKMRAECWDKAMQAFGAHYIYKKRLSRMGGVVAWSKVTGFVLPVLLGGIVGGYYQNKAIMDFALIVTAPVGIAQLVLSAILTAQNTENNLVKYASLSVKNMLLSADFKELGQFPPTSEDEMRLHYKVLLERERGLSEEDVDVSDKENRRGMRYGLREFQRECVGCRKVPVSMTPTDCHVCGNF